MHGPAGRRADPVRLQHADPLRPRPEPGHPAGLPQRARDAGGRLPERHVGRRRRQGRRRGGRRRRWPQSCIIAPSGQIVAQAFTTGDELVVARCDLDWCARYKGTLFDFDRYRRPELYTRITAQRGVIEPPEADEAAMTAIEPTDRRHVGFTLNGDAGRRAGRPPAPAGGAARGARRHLAEGRLLAVGPVRLLHGAASTARPSVSCQQLARPRSPASRSSRSRASTPTSASASPTPSPPAAALQCGFCIPGIVVRAKALIDKKGADLDRDDDGPPPRRPPLPLHRLREDPRRHRAARQGQDGRAARAAAASARAAPSTRRVELALGDKRLRRRHARRRACCTPRCASPTTPAPTSSRIDVDGGRGGARRRRACSPPPTSPASCASG